MTELLDKLHANGLAAAQKHFDALSTCMHAVLPEGVRETIPKTLEDVAGLFSASTKEFYLIILANTPGYESMNVVFEYISRMPVGEWKFKKFCVMIGGGGIFSAPKEYTAYNIEDALVLSKQIATWQEKYKAEHPAGQELLNFPATAKPN